MAYCTVADLLAQIDSDALTELTDGVSAPNEAVVASEVAAVESIMNGYLGKAAALPFVTVPAMVKTLAVDITIHRLFQRKNMTVEEREDRYRAAIVLLEGIAQGKAMIGDAGGVEAGSMGPDYSTPATLFDDETWGKY